MNDDEFIMNVDRALGMLAAAFISVGMSPPTAVLLGSADDIERLRYIRPTNTVRNKGGDFPQGVVCRIHGVDFRRDFYRTN